MAHTLKGLAATFGLVELQRQASDIEQALKHEMTEAAIQPLLDPLAAQLNIVCTAINSLPPVQLSWLLAPIAACLTPVPCPA